MRINVPWATIYILKKANSDNIVTTFIKRKLVPHLTKNFDLIIFIDGVSWDNIFSGA